MMWIRRSRQALSCVCAIVAGCAFGGCFKAMAEGHLYHALDENRLLFPIPFAYYKTRGTVADLLGIDARSYDSSYDCVVDSLTLFPPIAVATLASYFLARRLLWRPSEQRRDTVCRKCGYNLTGLTEPRCPECGTPFDAQLSAGRGGR
jgi:hypothetical protein